MALSFIKVYFDFEERAEMLTEEEQGRLLLAMLRHAKGKEPPALTGNERFLFPIFKIDIDKDKESYFAKVTNGSKGGRPKTTDNQNEPNRTKDNLTKPNETERNLNKPNFEEQEQEQDQDQDKDKEQEQEQEPRTRTPFNPPTIEDVQKYANAQKLTGFDAKRFVDYYNVVEWMVGGEPMKSWKAMVKIWAKSDSEKLKGNPALCYEQRDNSAYDSYEFLDLDHYGGDDP